MTNDFRLGSFMSNCQHRRIHWWSLIKADATRFWWTRACYEHPNPKIRWNGQNLAHVCIMAWKMTLVLVLSCTISPAASHPLVKFSKGRCNLFSMN
jgi:hypothetical protein